MAADTSSRTSNGLLRVLCYESFGIDPEFIPMAPRPAEMLRRCDAALVIGDAALFFNHARAGAEKIDLGEQWTKMSGLPFIWAFWAGRPGALESRPDPAAGSGQGCRRGWLRRDRRGLLRTRAGRGGQALPEGEYPLRLGPA